GLRNRLSRSKHLDKLSSRRAEYFAFAMNDGDWSCEALGEIDRAQRSCSHFVLHGRARNDSHAKISFDRSLDRFDVVELHHILNSDPAIPKNLIHRFASRDVALKPDKALPVKRADIDSLLRSKLVFRTTNENQRVVSKRYDVDLRPLRRIRNDSDIDHMIDDILIDLVGSAVFNVHVHLRIRLDKALQHRRQLVNTNRVNRRHAHLAANDIPQSFHLFGKRIEALHDLAAALIKSHSGVGRHESPAPAPLHQPPVESILKRSNLLADG